MEIINFDVLNKTKRFKFKMEVVVGVKSAHQVRINTSKWPAGVYFIAMPNNPNRSFKVLKQE